jgi:hypothetical protein
LEKLQQKRESVDFSSEEKARLFEVAAAEGS